MTNASNIKKKITPKDMNPKQILATPETVREIELGTIIGIANAISSTVSPQGEILEGLSGQFLWKPDAEGASPIAAYVLWLPSGMGTDLFDGPRQKESIEFAFRMGVNKADNPAGYEWFMRPLVAPSQANPLAVLEARVSGALEAPKSVPEAASKAKGDKAVAE